MAPSDKKRKKEKVNKETNPGKKQTLRTGSKAMKVEKEHKTGNINTASKFITESGAKSTAIKKALHAKKIPAAKKVGGTIHEKVKKTEPNRKKTKASESSKPAKGKETSKRISPKSKTKSKDSKEANRKAANKSTRQTGQDFASASGNRKRKAISQTDHKDNKSCKISLEKTKGTDVQKQEKTIQADFVYSMSVYERDDLKLKCEITGIDIFPSGELILVDMRNKKIKLYSKRFAYRSAIQLDTIIQDISISCADVSCAYFTKPLKPDGIQKISMVEGQISLRESFETTGENRGIICTTTGILTTVSDLQKINLYDYEGTLLQSLSTDQSGKALFTCPIYITANNTGQQIVVSDSHHIHGGVVGVDLSGKITFKENNVSESRGMTMISGDAIHTNDLSNLREPHGITTDDDDNIYMTDACNHNVSVLSPTGKRRQILIDPMKALEQGVPFGLRKPYQLCYNRMKGQLLVSEDRSNLIKVFNIVK